MLVIAAILAALTPAAIGKWAWEPVTPAQQQRLLSEWYAGEVAELPAKPS